MADMLKTVIGDAASGEPRTFDTVQAAKEHPELVSSEMEARARELVKRWRDRADAHEQNALHACSIGLKESADSMDEKARALRGFADELESLLSAASDHQQNAAQGGGE